jgi:hypothetical protein
MRTLAVSAVMTLQFGSFGVALSKCRCFEPDLYHSTVPYLTFSETMVPAMKIIRIGVLLLVLSWSPPSCVAFLPVISRATMLRYTSTDSSMFKAPASSNETSAGLFNASPSSSASSNGSTRWANSGRWEDELSSQESTGGSYLLKEKYGTYFQVPNPASLMTKIICTIGPATGDLTTLGRMMDAGMTAARINMVVAITPPLPR